MVSNLRKPVATTSWGLHPNRYRRKELTTPRKRISRIHNQPGCGFRELRDRGVWPQPSRWSAPHAACEPSTSRGKDGTRGAVARRPGSRPRLRREPRALLYSPAPRARAGGRLSAIGGPLERHPFSGLVYLRQVSCYTHSLAGSDFHGHRPAVWRYLLWYLMSGHLGTLARRSVHPHPGPLANLKFGPR